MRHLLDVNLLIAAIVQTHGHHVKAKAWLDAGNQPVLCPLAELGFLRIVSYPRAIGLKMEEARESLERFMVQRKAEWVADNLPALNSRPRTTDQVTDHYLADLAAKHGLTLATLDAGLKHPSVLLVR